MNYEIPELTTVTLDLDSEKGLGLLSIGHFHPKNIELKRVLCSIRRSPAVTDRTKMLSENEVALDIIQFL